MLNLQQHIIELQPNKDFARTCSAVSHTALEQIKGLTPPAQNKIKIQVMVSRRATLPLPVFFDSLTNQLSQPNKHYTSHSH